MFLHGNESGYYIFLIIKKINFYPNYCLVKPITIKAMPTHVITISPSQLQCLIISKELT
jgi:hypothetical protein